MKYYEFNYLKNFKCINKDCKHNCCIGWEIDVDDESMEYYKKIKGYENGINFTDKQLKLKENNRCFFLDDDNLCKIIKEHGENALCETCSLHPRFKNFFSDREELGLGLSCEEAGRIILTGKEKISLKTSKNGKENLTSWEKDTLKYRTKLLKIIQDDKSPLNEKIGKIEKLANTNEDDLLNKVNAKFLSSLEILSENWKTYLTHLNVKPKVTANFKPEYENLISYFIYRHITNAFDGKDLVTRTKFCLLSYYVIKRLCDATEETNGATVKDLIEYARAYSSEIEYSNENLNAILDKIEE